MLSSGTIAVWFISNPGSNQTRVEAHFNYWRIAGDKTLKRLNNRPVADFLEIGLLVSDVKQIASISIYLPIGVSPTNVADCAERLSNELFAQGIFNEVLTTKRVAPGEPPCVVLLDQNQQTFCRVHSFKTGTSGTIDPSELEITLKHEGSVISITNAAIKEAVSHVRPTERYYFRLRFYLPEDPEANPFVKVIRPTDRLFQSGFEEIEYIDFRMNEARTLPRPIEQTMRADRAKGGPVTFELLAFLTAVPVRSELSVSNTPSHKMRLLEPSWSGYVGLGILNEMVVYHWKRLPEKNKPITDFSAFAKLQTRRSSRSTLTTYLAIAFVFSLAGNLVASELFDLLGSLKGARAETPGSLPLPTRQSLFPPPCTLCPNWKY